MARPPWRSGKSSSKCPPDNPPHNHTAPLAPYSHGAPPPGRAPFLCLWVPRPVCAFLYAAYAALREKTSPLTRRIVPSKFHMSPASRPDTRNCLNSLPPESPPPLRRLSIRPVAQTDGSFGQTSLQGPETSGNVLNRSLRCFLPCAAIDPGEGAYRLVNSPDTNTCGSVPRSVCAFLYAPGSRSPSRGHMHSAHSSVRSGMWSPLRASLSLSATTVSPGGRRIQARGTSTPGRAA